MNLRWKVAQAAEIRWWNRYLRNKEVNTYMDQKRAYWHRVLDACNLNLPKGAKVLDAGCGPAGIFIAIPHCEVIAIDPLLDAYERQLPHFQAADYPYVQFRCQPIESISEQGVFDWVFCLNVINHVADLNKSLDALWAALKPGASLVLSVDAHNHAFLKRLFQLIPGDILHPHQYSLLDYQQMLLHRKARIDRTILLKKERIFNYYLFIAQKPEPFG